jgi:hypothetical protein
LAIEILELKLKVWLMEAVRWRGAAILWRKLWTVADALPVFGQDVRALLRDCEVRVKAKKAN